MSLTDRLGTAWPTLLLIVGEAVVGGTLSGPRAAMGLQGLDSSGLRSDWATPPESSVTVPGQVSGHVHSHR